jgi:hypothetical protein
MARVPDTAQYPKGIQPLSDRVLSQGLPWLAEELSVQRGRANGHHGRHAIPG